MDSTFSNRSIGTSCRFENCQVADGATTAVTPPRLRLAAMARIFSSSSESELDSEPDSSFLRASFNIRSRAGAAAANCRRQRWLCGRPSGSCCSPALAAFATAAFASAAPSRISDL